MLLRFSIGTREIIPSLGTASPHASPLWMWTQDEPLRNASFSSEDHWIAGQWESVGGCFMWKDVSWAPVDVEKRRRFPGEEEEEEEEEAAAVVVDEGLEPLEEGLSHVTRNVPFGENAIFSTPPASGIVQVLVGPTATSPVAPCTSGKCESVILPSSDFTDSTLPQGDHTEREDGRDASWMEGGGDDDDDDDDDDSARRLEELRG
jgi:hypothetical protein